MDDACRQARIAAAGDLGASGGHIDGCPACLDWRDQARRGLEAIRAYPAWGEVPPGADGVEMRPRRRPTLLTWTGAWTGAWTPWTGAAAAALVLCAVVFVARARPAPARVADLRGEVEIAGRAAQAGSVWQVGEMLRPRAGGGVRVLLGDGTVLEADGPASLVRESAADGERERIRLREGTVSIRARHGARPLVIAVPQGWVRVIGTVLVVSLHEGPAAGGDASPPAFCVIEVLEGTVQIEGSGVETRSIEMRSVETLPAGTRGILAASGPPMRQEIPASAPDAAQRTRLEDEARACLARGDERGAVLLLAAARHRMTGGAQAAPGVAE